jgi:hypothetical protein
VAPLAGIAGTRTVGVDGELSLALALQSFELGERFCQPGLRGLGAASPFLRAELRGGQAHLEIVHETFEPSDEIVGARKRRIIHVEARPLALHQQTQPEHGRCVMPMLGNQRLINLWRRSAGGTPARAASATPTDHFILFDIHASGRCGVTSGSLSRAAHLSLFGLSAASPGRASRSASGARRPLG